MTDINVYCKHAETEKNTKTPFGIINENSCNLTFVFVLHVVIFCVLTGVFLSVCI
jgi:hypothetical protein